MAIRIRRDDYRSLCFVNPLEFKLVETIRFQFPFRDKEGSRKTTTTTFLKSKSQAK